MRIVLSGFLILALVSLAACSIPKVGLPRVHKISVQQGNVITQEMIDRLRPGMTRNQVAFVMGEPVFRNAFNDDRWDYIYTLEIPGIYEQRRHASLYFEDDLLAYFTGDFAPADAVNGVVPETPGIDALIVPDAPEEYVEPELY